MRSWPAQGRRAFRTRSASAASYITPNGERSSTSARSTPLQPAPGGSLHLEILCEVDRELRCARPPDPQRRRSRRPRTERPVRRTTAGSSSVRGDSPAVPSPGSRPSPLGARPRLPGPLRHEVPPLLDDVQRPSPHPLRPRAPPCRPPAPRRAGSRPRDRRRPLAVGRQRLRPKGRPPRRGDVRPKRHCEPPQLLQVALHLAPDRDLRRFHDGNPLRSGGAPAGTSSGSPPRRRFGAGPRGLFGRCFRTRAAAKASITSAMTACSCSER